MAKYTYRGWTIGNTGNRFCANKGGFFTGYHDCDTTGQFLDMLDSKYGSIA